MRLMFKVLAFGGVAVAAACVQATPETQLRLETVAPAGARLCERMAGDFDMVLVEDGALRGRLFRVSHADRMISARGVSWGFRLIDDDASETCESLPNGSRCAIEGPAEFRIQSNAGRATYIVRAGDRAEVTSEGAIMTCRETPATF